MPLLNTADAVYAGDTLADAVYVGATKVWPEDTGPQQWEWVYDTTAGLGLWCGVTTTRHDYIYVNGTDANGGDSGLYVGASWSSLRIVGPNVDHFSTAWNTIDRTEKGGFRISRDVSVQTSLAPVLGETYVFTFDPPLPW